MIPGEGVERGGSMTLLCVFQAVADPLCALAFTGWDSRGAGMVSVVERYQDVGVGRSLKSSEA